VMTLQLLSLLNQRAQLLLKLKQNNLEDSSFKLKATLAGGFFSPQSFKQARISPNRYESIQLILNLVLLFLW
jgi:hypothetical protein